ncbi:MAG TPA: hypothetical protein VNM67_26315 [Thermoanaerobaculia bacterium]|jgi:hypothetical protein|nr:hypothetical protein [Thermoanaerobaculia bacterium]
MTILPGLYVALLALGLGWALRRWFDPVPPRILILFALVPFLLFGRALLGGEVLLPLGPLQEFVPYRHLPPMDGPSYGLYGDLIRQIAPWQVEVRRALAAGRWPLWNANAGAGMPLMGDPQSQAFQPLVMISYLFDPWSGMGITASLRVLLALVFFFLLLRRLGMGEPAAVLGAVAYGLGGFLILWLGWPMSTSAALLPLGLYAALRVDELGGSRDLFLLFLAGFGLFLGGHPETVVYALALVGMFLVARTRARRSLRPLLHGGLALVLSGLAAAPVLLPVKAYLPISERSVLVGHFLAPRPLSDVVKDLGKPAVRGAWKSQAEKRLVPLAAARAFGAFTHYWGDVNVIEDSSGFVGGATLLLALAGLAPVPGRRQRFPQERLAAGVLIACLLLIAQPPGFDRLFARLPVIGATAIHRHHRTLMLVALCVSWLAACEAERWQRSPGKRRLVAILAVALAGVIAWAYLGHNHPTLGRDLAGQRDAWMIAQIAFVALGAALLGVRNVRDRRAAAWILPLVVGAELLILHLPLNPSSPRRLAYPVTPPVRFVQERLGNFRMVAFGPTVLPANVHEVYNFRDVRIDNPSRPDLYMRVVTSVNQGALLPSFNRVRHAIYSLLGVRYVMTEVDTELRRPLRLVFRHPSGWVYERPGALPLLFLPARAVPFQGGNWQRWLDKNPDFAQRALVQRTPGGGKWRARKPEASTLQLLEVEPAQLRARAELSEPRLLASSLMHDDNWRLLVDGRPREILAANGPFVAAWLETGEREVELVYRPRSFVVGCLLSALALAMAAVWWVPRPATTARRQLS